MSRSVTSHTQCSIFVQRCPKMLCSLVLMSELKNRLTKSYFYCFFKRWGTVQENFIIIIIYFVLISQACAMLLCQLSLLEWMVLGAVLYFYKIVPSLPYLQTAFKTWLCGKICPCTHLGGRHWNQFWDHVQVPRKIPSLRSSVFILELSVFIFIIIIFNSRTVSVKEEWNFYLYSHPYQEARSKPIRFLSGSCKGYCIHLYQGPAYVQAWQSITYAVFLPAKDITVRVDASSFPNVILFCCSPWFLS